MWTGRAQRNSSAPTTRGATTVVVAGARRRHDLKELAVHFVVMGCGRVGAALALHLSSIGHSVAVIDHDERSFRRLGDDFPGQTVLGVGFDRRVLAEARTGDAAAFAAVSSGDNSNIIAARAARQLYGVRTVVARIYDPGRAEVYERLGVATVPTVRWTTQQVLDRLIPGRSHREFQDVSGAISMIQTGFDLSWVGMPITELERRLHARLAFVTRLGEGVVPFAQMRVQEGDVLHVLTPTDRRAEVETMLIHPVLEEEDQ